MTRHARCPMPMDVLPWPWKHPLQIPDHQALQLGPPRRDTTADRKINTRATAYTIFNRILCAVNRAPATDRPSARFCVSAPSGHPEGRHP